MNRSLLAGPASSISTSTTLPNALPPPRFATGEPAQSLRDSLQKDPVLRLIPSKRPPAIDPASLPPLPSLPSPSSSSEPPSTTSPAPARAPRPPRKYHVRDLPVEGVSWQSQFELWAHQEIDILDRENRPLALAERQIIFGQAWKAKREPAMEILRKEEDPHHFPGVKDHFARMLNRHRLKSDMSRYLIPTLDQDDPLLSGLNLNHSRSSTGASTQDEPSSSATPDVKPASHLLAIRGEGELEPAVQEGRGRGGGGREVPNSSSTQTSDAQQVDSAAAPVAPRAMRYQMRGMDEPFPPFLVEIYLSTRLTFDSPSTSLGMIKGIFPLWTERVGDAKANEFIEKIEEAALAEERAGTLTEEERARRKSCVVWVADRMPDGPGARSQRRTTSESTRNNASRTTSPVVPRTQPAPRVPVAVSSPSPAIKACNKCVAEELECDLTDPCGPCRARGRFHLCIFPDPPPAPAPRRSSSSSTAQEPEQSVAPSGVRNDPKTVNSTLAPRPTTSQPPKGGVRGWRPVEQFSPPPPHPPRPPSNLSSSLGSKPPTSVLAQKPPPVSRTISFPPPGRQSISLDQARSLAQTASKRARENSNLDETEGRRRLSSGSTVRKSSNEAGGTDRRSGTFSRPPGSSLAPPVIPASPTVHLPFSRDARIDDLVNTWTHSHSNEPNAPAPQQNSPPIPRPEQARPVEPFPNAQRRAGLVMPHRPPPALAYVPPPMPPPQAPPPPCPIQSRPYDTPAWNTLFRELPGHLNVLVKAVNTWSRREPSSYSMSRPPSNAI